MITERRLAMLVEKCYAGTAKNMEIYELLKETLKLTDFGKSLKGKTTSLLITKTETETGLYFRGKKIIYLKETLFEDIQKRKVGAVSQILETFGHENKHFFQDLHGHFDINDKVQGSIDYRKSQVELMGRISSCDEDSIEDMKFYMYLDCLMEVQARETGEDFMASAMGLFLQNRFISEDTKALIRRDIHKMADRHISRKQEEQNLAYQYEKFKESYRKNFVNYDMTHMIGYEVINAAYLWLEMAKPADVAKGYMVLIDREGEDKIYGRVRMAIKQFILSDDCSPLAREELEEMLLKKCISENCGEKFYLEDNIDILSAESSCKIYEHILKNDLSKLVTPFSENILKNPKTREIASQIFIEHIFDLGFKRKNGNGIDSCYYSAIRTLFKQGKDLPLDCVMEVFVHDKLSDLSEDENLAKFVLSNECHPRRRKQVASEVTKLLKSGDAPDEWYKTFKASDLLKILSEEQALEIYEGILNNHPEILNSRMVFMIIFDNEETASKAADIFFSSIKNMYENASPETLEALQQHCKMIGARCSKTLTIKQKEILNHISGVNSNQKSASK